MDVFSNRIKATSSQKNEVCRYLGVPEILNELTVVKIVRKLKDIERKINEKQY